MKLQTYFNQKKDHGLSDIQKMDVYYAIMDKNMKKSFQKKRSFLHVKSFIYTSFVLFFLVGLYGMYFFQQQPIDDSEGYLLSRLANTNVAQADFVAKIVDFDGSFSIEQNGKSVQTSNIKDGDIVTLKESTQVVFHIDNDTKAKISGPARFVINKKGASGYRVAMIYGQYIEMSSLQKENKYAIELAIDNIVISQGERKKPINFQLVKQGENHVIKNNGAKLLVSSNDNKETTNVSKKQILSVQGNDISLFDNFEKFTKAVKDKNLSQTFTLNTILDTINPADTGANQSIKELEGQEILSVEDKEDIPEIDLGLDSGDQKVATPEQTKTIDTQLNKYFLTENLNQLIAAYKGGNVDEFAKEFTTLEKRISMISASFQYDYQSAKGSQQEKIQAISTEITKLAEHITKKYLLPPKYVESLKSILPSIAPLKSIQFVEKLASSGTNETL